MAMETHSHQKSAFPELPEYILREIASRSPSLSTLTTLRATSKSLSLATFEPTFVHAHSASGFLIQSLVKNQYVIEYLPAYDRVSEHYSFKLDFLPLKVRVNACSDALGLVYCESQEPQSSRNSLSVKNHCICKVTTGEWLQIPNPKTRLRSMVSSWILVVKLNPLRFKVFRFDQPDKQPRVSFTRYTCHVFDSENPGKWRKLEKEILLPYDNERIAPDSPVVTVNGNLHLLIEGERIIALDSVTEDWNFLPTPVSDDNLRLKLSQYQGKLSFVAENRTNKTVIVWVMEDYNNKVWTRSYQLSTEGPRAVDSLLSLTRLCNSDTGLFVGYRASLFYNFRDGSYRKKALQSLPHSVFEFRSDFKKLGWKTASEAEGYLLRQRAKEWPSNDPNLRLVRGCLDVFLRRFDSSLC